MYFHEKVKTGYYDKVDIDYLECPTKVCPGCDCKITNFKEKKFCYACGADLQSLHKKHEEFVVERTFYKESQNKKATEFKKNLLEEHNVLDNPKAQKCYELAWDYGHSSGYYAVADYFNELVGLIL